MYILMHMRARAHGCVRACSACARVLRVEAYARTYGSTCGEPAPLTPSLWPELSSTKQSFVESHPAEHDSGVVVKKHEAEHDTE